MNAYGMKSEDRGPEPDALRARRMAMLVRDQRALCLELGSLSQTQSVMVEGGDSDGVLEVLGQRQQVIDRMSRLNEELAPLRDQRETLLTHLAQSEREAIRAAIHEIGELVESVRHRDEQDREVMVRRRAGIAGEISGVSRARGAVAAYSGTRAPVPAKFQDRQG